VENSHQRRQTTTLVIRSPTFAAGWWWWWWCAPSSRSWSWSPSGRRVKAALLWTVALPFVAGRAGLAPPPPGRPPFRSSTFYPAERDREMADDESSGTRRPFLADRLFSLPLSLSLSPFGHLVSAAVWSPCASRWCVLLSFPRRKKGSTGQLSWGMCRVTRLLAHGLPKAESNSKRLAKMT
jgi:hypothetical protein